MLHLATGGQGKIMINKIRSLVGIVILSILGTTTASGQSQPVINEETGHYYQVANTGPITWTAAAAAVSALPCLLPDGSTAGSCTDPGAVTPHLATLTSAREEVFVDTLRDSVLSANGGPAQTWIGGIQIVTPPGVEPFDGWQWVNDEGNFPGVNGGTVYTNWNPAEPNNAGGEDHLALGRYGLGLGWNDELQTRASIRGYIAEWDVPRSATECSASQGGCITIEGHELTFPDNSPLEGQQLSFNSFELNDPRVAAGTCGSVGLEIFGNTGIGAAPGVMSSMFIPPYLCGSPKFVVVTVDTGLFNLESGTVFVENDTATVLPANVYPDGGASVCEDPIVQNPFTDGDPQYQDVVVWQATDFTAMLENDLGAAAGYPGSAGEFTNECGSSRARVRGASYYGIGFHIDFGPGNTWIGNPVGNFNSFVALTRYKLTLLQQAVENAKSDGAFAKNGDYTKIKNQVANAINNIDGGDYDSAYDHAVNVVKFVDKAKYNTVAGQNYEGEHIMRGTNIEFMLRVKVLPYTGP